MWCFYQSPLSTVARYRAGVWLGLKKGAGTQSLNLVGERRVWYSVLVLNDSMEGEQLKQYQYVVCRIELLAWQKSPERLWPDFLSSFLFDTRTL